MDKTSSPSNSSVHSTTSTEPTLSFSKGEGIPSIQISKTTTKRKNTFLSSKKSEWGDPRVGFGWDFIPPTKENKTYQKVPNSKEYPILLEIQSLYEDGEIISSICKKLNEYDTKKNKGKDWNTTSLKFICEKNEMIWCKNINKDYFEDSSKDVPLFKIKNFTKFLEDHPQIKTSEDFWKFFGNKGNGKGDKGTLLSVPKKPYYKGVKVTITLLKEYLQVDDESTFYNTLRTKIEDWVNNGHSQTLSETKKKIIKEFGDNEKYGEMIKGWSDQTFWRKIGKVLR